MPKRISMIHCQASNDTTKNDTTRYGLCLLGDLLSKRYNEILKWNMHA